MTDSEASVMGSGGQTTVAGRYRLLALVASGGMGRVWRAHDELLDREVAIKELTAPAGMPVTGRREVQLRTVREARAAARLDHPGVVRIFDVVQATGRSWIVMEYIPSRSLHQVVAEDGPLTHQEAACVGLAVLSALTAAHAAGVLHLDVKPHNVLITADRRIVLTDFGLATVSAAPGSSTVSVDGEPLLGSPHYIAPERLRGAAGDARMDLWSLGASLYAAVEGRPPFDRPSNTESLTAVLVDAPDPPRRPGPLHPVIAGLLAADPARRWGAAQAQAALSALTRHAVGVVSVPAPRRPTHDAVRFRPAAVTVAPVAPSDPAAPEPTATPAPGVATPTRSRRLRIALAGVAVITAAAPVVFWQAGGDSAARPASGVAAEPTAATACAGAAPQPVTDAPGPAPYALRDGWLWHVDSAAFALPVPRPWTRAVNADVVCFTDPDGARTLTVQPGPALTGEPLRQWQAAEEQALTNGTLPGYQKISMGVLLVSGGGADWEYTWQPPTGPRLHTYRVLRSAGARSHLLTWTTPDQDWELNQTHRRTILDGVRDPSASPSPWAVPAPPRSHTGTQCQISISDPTVRLPVTNPCRHPPIDEETPVRLRRTLLAVPAAAAVLLAVPSAAYADESVQVQLDALNNSGASGTATLTTTDKGDLKVSIRSKGMVPNSPHAQHLHGAVTGMDFHCPDMSADKDGDGFLTVEEGLPMYGDIFISLTTKGDTTKTSGLAVDRMPTADADGNLSYDRTIPAADLPDGTIENLKDLHVVQHGIDANNNDKYDLDGRGESTLAKSAGLEGIPGEVTDPATCGMISGAAAGSVPVGGVATGDGTTRDNPTPMYAIGGVALLAALGAFAARRRLSTQG